MSPALSLSRIRRLPKAQGFARVCETRLPRRVFFCFGALAVRLCESTHLTSYPRLPRKSRDGVSSMAGALVRYDVLLAPLVMMRRTLSR